MHFFPAQWIICWGDVCPACICCGTSNNLRKSTNARPNDVTSSRIDRLLNVWVHIRGWVGNKSHFIRLHSASIGRCSWCCSTRSSASVRDQKYGIQFEYNVYRSGRMLASNKINIILVRIWFIVCTDSVRRTCFEQVSCKVHNVHDVYYTSNCESWTIHFPQTSQIDFMWWNVVLHGLKYATHATTRFNTLSNYNWVIVHFAKISHTLCMILSQFDEDFCLFKGREARRKQRRIAWGKKTEKAIYVYTNRFTQFRQAQCIICTFQ